MQHVKSLQCQICVNSVIMINCSIDSQLFHPLLCRLGTAELNHSFTSLILILRIDCSRCLTFSPQVVYISSISCYIDRNRGFLRIRFRIKTSQTRLSTTTNIFHFFVKRKFTINPNLSTMRKVQKAIQIQT